MCKCERCGMALDDDQVFNADEFGYSSLCEDCNDVVCVYEEEDDE